MPFHNSQRPLPMVGANQNNTLDVIKIFETIQGEGPLYGCPCVFIRLAHCNLRCPACDTDYTLGAITSTTEVIVEDILKAREGGSFVVITGGEPFRQNISPLVGELISKDIFVQIETNGTIYREDFNYYDDENLLIVCSPKNTHVDDRLVPHVGAWKYVLKHGKLNSLGLPSSCLGMSSPPFIPDLDQRHKGWIFVSPQDDQDDEQNKLNIKAVVESSLKHGYRVSLQTHKILGVE